MNRYLDISLPVSLRLPQWPGSPEYRVVNNHDLKTGDSFTDNSIHMNLHTGTHVDAPSHFDPEGETVEMIPLDILLGEVYVANISYTIKEITAEILSLAGIPKGCKRVLLKTRNSLLWEKNEQVFYKDFTALVEDAAQWLVDKGVKLIGIDYLSIQRYADGPKVHEILLSSGIVVVEGLDLSKVRAKTYKMYCLPVRLEGMEAAPARVVLEEIFITEAS